MSKNITLKRRKYKPNERRPGHIAHLAPDLIWIKVMIEKPE